MGDRLASVDMGRKVGGCGAPFRGGVGSPSITMSPGPRPTSVPGDILIHPTGWPQHTNVTDRQNRQTGQRSRSIGQTVTYNDRPKTTKNSGKTTAIQKYKEHSATQAVLYRHNTYACGSALSCFTTLLFHKFNISCCFLASTAHFLP